MIKKAVKGLIVLILLLLVIVLYNTITLNSKQPAVEVLPPIPIDSSSLLHLSKAVTFKTISYDQKSLADTVVFEQFVEFLKTTYPLVDSILNPIRINGYSLLYEWKGNNQKLNPIILLAHMDVVPLGEDTTSANWQYPAFSGKITDSCIWGRGTLDDKVGVISILEAVTKLLEKNITPERTIYLAFGHDEEVGGVSGAKSIADYLRSKNIMAEYLLDEGLLLTQGIIPGIDKTTALIGVAEKGDITIELSVAIHGGHSSMPEKQSAIGILSSAVGRLENSPLKAKISKPVQSFLDYIGPEMPFLQRIAFANVWLFKSLIIDKYEASPSGNALVRTTLAPTLFNAGYKANVLPSEAKAIVNLRIIPGETTGEIISHIKNTIQDNRIQIVVRADSKNENIKVSSTSSYGFESISKSIKQVFPDVLLAPALMIASTDSKHYTDVAKDVYRFLPIRANSSDLKRIHGVNERIYISNYKECINFYYRLLLQNKSNK